MDLDGARIMAQLTATPVGGVRLPVIDLTRREVLGNVRGGDHQAAEGRADQTVGQVQAGVDDTQQTIGDAVGRTGRQKNAAGQGDQLVGGLKERLGEATGNRDVQAEGAAQQDEGKANEGVAGLKDGVEKLLGGDR